MALMLQKVGIQSQRWMKYAKGTTSSTTYLRKYGQDLPRRTKDQHSSQNIRRVATSKHNCSVATTGSQNNQIVCQKLDRRGVVRVSGVEAGSFLQGLVTNDMAKFEKTENSPGCDSIYAMILNVQGRVLYDLIIYKPSQKDSMAYLLECDKEVIPDFIKLMKRYKIRKKIDIADVSKELDVWAAFSKDFDKELTTSPSIYTSDDTTEQFSAFTDPRLGAIGKRLILNDNQTATSLVPGSVQSLADDYLVRRYQLGIGEGVIDMPPGGALPLECNAAFLNGVSFSKGCYIGQELTARSHHTGVIRKRLMPLVFSSETQSCHTGDTVENYKGKNCGKFRNSVGKYGLGLLRIGDVIGKGNLCVKRVEGEGKDTKSFPVGEVTTHIPQWWPRDSDEIVKQVLAAETKMENL